MTGENKFPNFYQGLCFQKIQSYNNFLPQSFPRHRSSNNFILTRLLSFYCNGRHFKSEWKFRPNKRELKQKMPSGLHGWTKELLTKLRYEKEVYRKWKQRQLTWEEYRDTVWVCRDVVRKAKAHLDLHLMRHVNGNKKGFYKYISDKTKTREYIGLLLKETGTWWHRSS